MIYRMEAIDETGNTYELWAHNTDEACSRLQEECEEGDYQVFFYGSLPKNLTFEMIKEIQDSPALRDLMYHIDDVFGQFLDKYAD